MQERCDVLLLASVVSVEMKHTRIKGYGGALARQALFVATGMQFSAIDKNRLTLCNRVLHTIYGNYTLTCMDHDNFCSAVPMEIKHCLVVI